MPALLQIATAAAESHALGHAQAKVAADTLNPKRFCGSVDVSHATLLRQGSVLPLFASSSSV